MPIMNTNLALMLESVRAQSEELCKPLQIEDYVIQSMADVSPIKWHLAHVTWFFETFILIPYLKNYTVFNSHYSYLFNSYYTAVGHFHPQDKRGILSRPSVDEIYRYRHYVDENLALLFNNYETADSANIASRIQLGINHEQQHQELMLMDIKFNFASNPLNPVYYNLPEVITTKAPLATPLWSTYQAGMHEIGFSGKDFAFDNESPRHPIYITSFQIRNNLITNAEYFDFMNAGGYQQPKFWLADGWKKVQQECWQCPLYWRIQDNNWRQMTLGGLKPLRWEEPVTHVSYYEADAYARFANARLPSEAEWEVVAGDCIDPGNFLESGYLHPISATHSGLTQFLGNVWEWTKSAYSPYPGYVPFPDEISEYNGKFACNQFVLRGGSILTPIHHIRPTYRNFYYPHQRWPVTGIRLVKDL